MIEIQHINKKFDDRTIFNDISYSFSDNSFYILRGENTCGKTTLLYILALFDFSYQGKVIVDGKDMTICDPSSRRRFRVKNLSFIPSEGNLIDSLSLRQNLYGKKDFTDLGLHVDSKRKPASLSGGERMILSLESEVIKKKKILLLDEVTSELDDENTKKILLRLKELSKTSLIIMASHDNRTFSYGKNLLLQDGKLHD
ncbi:MAG: ATP-binding cassette domain-containing protein [Bacilli bacterium]